MRSGENDCARVRVTRAQIVEKILAEIFGRIHIEKINWQFLHEIKGTPAEYTAGLERAASGGLFGVRETPEKMAALRFRGTATADEDPISLVCALAQGDCIEL